MGGWTSGPRLLPSALHTGYDVTARPTEDEDVQRENDKADDAAPGAT